MSIPNFPSTGLVPNVTTFQVGDILYMWDGEKWKSITAPLKADQITWKDGKTAGYSLDDLDGFTAELLDQAGIVDGGQPDKLGASQRVDALVTLFDRKFPTVAAMKAASGLKVGNDIKWKGYYTKGDKGGNTGVVKSGAHTEDGYKIFSISPTLYVEADVNNYDSFNLAKAGLRAGSAYDNKDVFALIPLFKSVEMFDGDYYTTEPWNILDFTTEKIEGASTENTRVFFDIPAEVFSVTIQSLYVRRTELKRFTIYPKAGSDTNCGLKVGKVGAWGASVLTNEFNVREFSGRVHLEDSAFNCTYNNALMSGPSNTRIAKILNYEATYEFGNCSTFNNSVINFGKIGIQNKGCSPIVFNSTTFESLTLMENTEQVLGLSMTSIKDGGCWYENIDYGIVNSKINETTLQPIIPAVKKCPIEGYIMQGGVVSTGVTLPVINALLEPYYVNTFSYTRGIVQPFNNLNLRDEFFYTNGLPVADPTVREITRDFDISNVFIINGTNKLSNINMLVEALGEGGNAMHARYETSSVPMPVSIEGSIYDPATIGDGAKITMTRIDATTVRIVARAKGLNYVKVVITNS